jgi:hypothetical protein
VKFSYLSNAPSSGVSYLKDIDFDADTLQYSARAMNKKGTMSLNIDHTSSYLFKIKKIGPKAVQSSTYYKFLK